MPDPPGGDIQYKPHHHHFPHEQRSSMGPETGMHLWHREPPFLWKLPSSCFNHYSDVRFARVCANVPFFLQWGLLQVCVFFLGGVGGNMNALCVFIMWPVFWYLCVYDWMHACMFAWMYCMCLHSSVHVSLSEGVGQLSVTTSWWGLAQQLTRETVSQSSPGRSVAMALAVQHPVPGWEMNSGSGQKCLLKFRICPLRLELEVQKILLGNKGQIMEKNRKLPYIGWVTQYFV